MAKNGTYIADSDSIDGLADSFTAAFDHNLRVCKRWRRIALLSVLVNAILTALLVTS